MIVYYSLLAVLLYLGLIKKLSEKYKKSENIIIFIAALLLFFFAAMRSINVGADTDQYCSHFLKIAATDWKDFANYTNGWYGDIETGYKIYNKLFSVFKNQQTITITNSLLQIGLISLVIIKQSDNKWLSFFLYFSLCFYQTALNLTPSSFVSYFLFLSFPYIKNQKLIKFFIFIGIGVLFHTSAIFFIPLYFLSKIKINKKTIGIALVVSLMIFVFYQSFIKMILIILPQKYLWYIDGSREHKGNTVELAVLIVQIIAIVFCMFQFKKEKQIDLIKSNQFVVWLLIYEVLLYLLSMISPMFSRGAFLFSPYVIIIVPNIIGKIKDKKRKLYITIGIVIYGALLYIIRVHVNNVGTTMPYEFFT